MSSSLICAVEGETCLTRLTYPAQNFILTVFHSLSVHVTLKKNFNYNNAFHLSGTEITVKCNSKWSACHLMGLSGSQSACNVNYDCADTRRFVFGL